MVLGTLATGAISDVMFRSVSVSPGTYHIAQNCGGGKLWRISDFKVLARKTLANA